MWGAPLYNLMDAYPPMRMATIPITPGRTFLAITRRHHLSLATYDVSPTILWRKISYAVVFLLPAREPFHPIESRLNRRPNLTQTNEKPHPNSEAWGIRIRRFNVICGTIRTEVPYDW